MPHPAATQDFASIYTPCKILYRVRPPREIACQAIANIPEGSRNAVIRRHNGLLNPQPARQRFAEDAILFFAVQLATVTD